jgi:LEA14-like dessication related protein
MSVFKSIQAIIAIITLASVSAGCAALSTASQKPRVSLASIRVLDIKGLETTFEIDLRIINRSQQSLNITGIDCELTLNGRQLAEGVANPKIAIEPYTDAVVPVKTYSSMLDMIGIARRLMKYAGKPMAGERFTYAISGHLQTGDGGWFGSVPFEDQGEIDLEGLTKAVN